MEKCHHCGGDLRPGEGKCCTGRLIHADDAICEMYRQDRRNGRDRIDQAKLNDPPTAKPPLPQPNKYGHYRLPDGCAIYPAADGCLNGLAIPGLGRRAGDMDSPRFNGKWRATWKNGVPLRGDDQGGEFISEFSSPQEAYECILSGGEGV